MKIKNWFWGIFFILGAILVIVNQMGYLIGINMFSLVITILLIPIIIKSSMYLNFSGILFPIALLCIVYAEPLGITNLTPWPVLITALLGSIGLSIIFHSSKKYCHWHKQENFENVINDPDGNAIDLGVSFGSSIKYINTNNFQKGNFRSSFGALKVYFDNAKLSPEGAIINLDISFSGVELYIPKTWNITNNVDAYFGGIEEKNSRTEKEGPIIILNGQVKFSGVEIIYV